MPDSPAAMPRQRLISSSSSTRWPRRTPPVTRPSTCVSAHWSSATPAYPTTNRTSRYPNNSRQPTLPYVTSVPTSICVPSLTIRSTSTWSVWDSGRMPGSPSTVCHSPWRPDAAMPYFLIFSSRCPVHSWESIPWLPTISSMRRVLYLARSTSQALLKTPR